MSNFNANRIWKSPVGTEILYLILGIGNLYLTWQGWQYLFVDAGRDYFLAWRVLEGEPLYSDYYHQFGPAGPMVAWAVFKVFGVHLKFLTGFNILLLAVSLFFLYQSLRAFTSRRNAHIGTLFFLGCFALQANPLNMNYVHSYAYAASLGIFFSLGCLYFMQKSLRRGGIWISIAAGLLFSMALLTKIETTVAVSILFLFYLLALGWLKKLVNLAPFITGAVIGLGVTLAWLISTGLPFTKIVQLTESALAGIIDVASASLDPTQNPFRAGLSGFDNVPGNLAVMFLQFVYIFGLAWLLYRTAVYHWEQYRISWYGWLGLVLLGIYLSLHEGPFRSVPIFLVIIAIVVLPWLIFPRWRTRETDSWASKLIKLCIIPLTVGRAGIRVSLWSAVLFLTLAIALCLRIVLKITFYHYAVFLGSLAICFALVYAFAWADSLTQRKIGSRKMIIALAIMVVALYMPFLKRNIDVHLHFFAPQAVEFPRGALKLEPQKVEPVKKFVKYLRDNLKPQDTLVLLPESSFLNFLTSRPTGFRYDMAGGLIQQVTEENYLEEMNQSPPDYVGIFTADYEEFGLRAFGHDFGLKTKQYVLDHYERVYDTGRDPLTDPLKMDFQMSLYRLKGENNNPLPLRERAG